MGKRDSAFDNSKKAQGRARKADAELEKANKAAALREAAESESWKVGSKDDSKSQAAAAKKAAAAAKKAERDALLAAEEASLKSPKPGGLSKREKEAAAAAKRKPARGLQLDDVDGQLSGDGSGGESRGGLAALNASGIDNALDALSLTGSGAGDRKIDRHPERRVKAAYGKFETRRLDEAAENGEFDGLTLRQKKERLRKEFEKSDENPFNQTNADYNATKEQLREIAEAERADIEARLTSPRLNSP